MKILVLGHKGLLGSKLYSKLKENDFDVRGVDKEEVSVANFLSLKKLFRPDFFNEIYYDYIFNCTGYTNVTLAETNYKEAFLLNSVSTGMICKVILLFGGHLVHFSTEYVFNGKSKIPYKEDHLTDPINYYGITKLNSETIIRKRLKENNYTIFRLQWLYGKDKGFFKWLAEEAKTKDSLSVIHQYGSPCSVDFVANTLCDLLKRKQLEQFKGETYHLTHKDYCDREECARYFIDKAKLNITLKESLPIEAYGKVPRPLFGVMDVSKFSKDFNSDLGSWKDDLDSYIKAM